MALSTKIGTFTAPSATGNQLVSWSIGGNWPANATPELVLLFTSGQTAAGLAASAASAVGAFNATQQLTFASFADGPALSGANTIATSNTGQSARTTAALVLLSNGTPTVLGVAAPGATRFQSNGFNLNWTTASASTSGIIIGYLAVAGLTETWVGALRSPTASGAQTTPVLGSGAAAWDAGLLIPSWHSTAAGVLTDGTTEQTFARSGIGLIANAGGTVQQVANIYHDNDGETAMDLTLGQSAALCLIQPANATNATPSPPQASLTSFNSDGSLTFSWSNVSTTTNKAFLGILLRGVSASVGVTTMPSVTTANTDVTVSGLTAQPKGLLLTTSGQTADAILTASLPDNATAEWAFGASDATTHATVTNFNQDTAADSEARRVWSSTAALNPYKYTAAAPAAGSSPTANASAGSAVLQATTASSFTLRWNGQDATQRRIGYLVLGDASVAPVTLSGSGSLGAVAGSGSLQSLIALSGSGILVSVTGSGAISMLVTLSGAGSLGDVAGTGQIVAPASVTGAAFLSSLTSTGSVTTTVPARTLSGTGTLDALSASGTLATLATLTTAAATMSAITASGTLIAPATLTGTDALAAVTSAGAITAPARLAGTGTLAGLTVSGSLQARVTLSGSAAMTSVTSAGAVGNVPVTLSGAAGLTAVTSSGVLVAPATMAGTASLGAITAGGSAATPATLSGFALLGSLSSTGTEHTLVTVTGAAALQVVQGSGVLHALAALTGVSVIMDLTSAGTLVAIPMNVTSLAGDRAMWGSSTRGRWGNPRVERGIR